MIHGYGIYRWADGSVYYGEYKEGNHDGQGYKKWADGDEYWGEWKNHKEWGEGVSQLKGVFERVTFDEVKLTSRSEYTMVEEKK